MGIIPREAWKLSFFEFRAVYKAWNERRIHDFDVMRHGASLGLMAHVDKKSMNKIAPSRLFPLPNDKPRTATMLTEAQANELAQLATRRLIDVKQIN